MKTNTLKAIVNIIKNNINNLEQYQNLHYKNRINNKGEALENLIKNSLCNSYNSNDIEKINLQNEYFSYLGNQNNPPDLIIKNGDAFEIKKIESNEGNIQLNSSFPKNKLYRNSKMLTDACKNCEDNWLEKDICYAIGCFNNKSQSIWFVYGDCYCAKPEVYAKIKNQITKSIEEIEIALTQTNEIAKVKKVDPLGITDLRVRGMWGIQHPSKVFSYITTKNSGSYIKAIMLESKFYSFDKNSRMELEKYCSIKKVKILDPNNPAILLDAIFIEYLFNDLKNV